MRGVLDVLTDDAGVRGASEDLAEVARRAEAAGIANTLTVTGAPEDDEERARRAVNRIVRECLTNAGRHAPGQPVTITVTWDPAAVCVETTNPADATSYSPGRGLAGLRHRAELLGGAFTASADGSTFTVRVRIPTGGAR
jgi:signal transduction histidine kinase